MDVSFSNVLEGARQYFQGLPATSNSTAAPTNSYNTPNYHPVNHHQYPQQQQPQHPPLHQPPSQQQHFPPSQQHPHAYTHQRAIDMPPVSSTSYWSPAGETRNPTTLRVPAPTQMRAIIESRATPENTHYFQPPAEPHAFRPFTSSSQSNDTNSLYAQNSHIARTHQEHITTHNSQTYHQLQNSTSQSSYYSSNPPNPSSYYPSHCQFSTANPSSASSPSSTSTSSYQPPPIYTESSPQAPYYSHIYSSTNYQTQTKPLTQNALGSLTPQHQPSIPNSQHFNSTINVPQIPIVPNIHYHHSTSNNHCNTDTSRHSSIPPPVVTSTTCTLPRATLNIPSGPSLSRSISIPSMPSSIRTPPVRRMPEPPTPISVPSRFPVVTSIASQPTTTATTTTQSYNSTLIAMSNFNGIVQHTRDVMAGVNSSSITIRHKRESPLDLSVRTVRPADSTADNDERPSPSCASNQSQLLRNYADLYGNVPNQSMLPRSSAATAPATLGDATPAAAVPQIPATTPRVDFHPNFNVPIVDSHPNQQRSPVLRVPCRDEAAPGPHRNGLHAAAYPAPQQSSPRKRPATSESASAPTSKPSKAIKIDTWRQSIDQQIEQRLSSYKQQQQQQEQKQQRHLDQQHLQPQEFHHMHALNNGHHYQQQEQQQQLQLHLQQQQQQQHLPHPQQQQEVLQHQDVEFNEQPNGALNAYTSTNINHTYVPSAVAHHYPPLGVQQNVPKVPPPPVNNGGADRRVISLLRNSLEVKEAQKKMRQDVQQPATDVTMPMRPKPMLPFAHVPNVSPFTPDTNTSAYTKIHMPKAIKSIPPRQLHNEVHTLVHNNSTGSAGSSGNTSTSSNNSNNSIANLNGSSDLDGLAAFLAARIRTKAELKHIASTPPSGVNTDKTISVMTANTARMATPSPKPVPSSPAVLNCNITVNSAARMSLSPKLTVAPPRRRLFSRNDEQDAPFPDQVPLRDKSGMRSSSETSVFDFPDSESDNELPVLEKQTLGDMRRDRKSSITGSRSAIMGTSDSDSVKNDENPVEMDTFHKLCESFIKELEGGSGKKRGRRKKTNTDDPESCTPPASDLDAAANGTLLDDTKNIEIKLVEGDNDNTNAVPENEETIEDEDSDNIPLSKIKQESEKVPQDEPGSLDCQSSSTDIGLKTMAINDLFGYVRPAKKPTFGDGSHFQPGWEQDQYRYKQSLRMPPSLIHVMRPPSYHRLSTSLPDLDPKSPLLIDIKRNVPKSDSDSESNASTMTAIPVIKREPNHSNSYYDSEDSIDTLSTSRSHELSISRTTLNTPTVIVSPAPPINCDTKSNILSGERSLSMLNRLFQKCCDARDRKHFKKKGRERLTVKGSTLRINSNLEGNESSAIRKSKRHCLKVEALSEHRPASAPPVTCLNNSSGHKMKEELRSVDEDDRITGNVELNRLLINNGHTTTTFRKTTDRNRHGLKNRLLDRHKKSTENIEQLCGSDTSSVKCELTDAYLDSESRDGSIQDDCKSETPSIDGDDRPPSGRRRYKLTKSRRKVSSGFDYIRKKKKPNSSKASSANAAAVDSNNVGSINASLNGHDDDELLHKGIGYRKRAGQFTSVKCRSESVEDIQKEIKTWVLNKGIGETHLHRSARLGYIDIAAYCLEKMDCSPSPKDNAGYTPLHEACARGHLSTARLLLQYGASVCESARGGIAPLHEAAENGYVELVRLLLSYGADPTLTTYSSMTPLALTTDETTADLLQSHINDTLGKLGQPFCFAGPASCFDYPENGFDLLLDAPSGSLSPELESPSDVEFEMSEMQLPNLYTLRGEPPTDRWVLLQDLSGLLRIKSRDALLRQISGSSVTASVPNGVPRATGTPLTGATAAGGGNYKSMLRELKMCDFLEQAHCCQFLNLGEKINCRASKIALVKYTDKVKELLNVECVKIMSGSSDSANDDDDCR